MIHQAGHKDLVQIKTEKSVIEETKLHGTASYTYNLLLYICSYTYRNMYQ